MIKFKHYPPNRLTVGNFYGIMFDIHPKRKSVDIYWGRHVFVFWIGRNYR